MGQGVRIDVSARQIHYNCHDLCIIQALVCLARRRRKGPRAGLDFSGKFRAGTPIRKSEKMGVWANFG